MKKNFMMSFASLAILGIALSSCGAAARPQVSRAHISGEAAITGVIDTYSVAHLNLYGNDTYELFLTEASYGYQMLAGATVYTLYGTYEKGAAVDGLTPITLHEAAEVIFNAFTATGAKLSANTANPDQVYPTELLASGEGEKVYADNKQDVIDAYGQGRVYYLEDESNKLYTSDPNNSDADPVEVTTKSGRVNPKLYTYESVYIYGGYTALGPITQFDIAQVMLTSDGRYFSFESNISYGYSMVAGVTTFYNSGTYGKHGVTDGYEQVELSRANSVYFNAYTATGAVLSANTDDPEQVYPTELLASGEGEKVYADNKDQVIDAYGAATTIYCEEGTNIFAFSDPNA